MKNNSFYSRYMKTILEFILSLTAVILLAPLMLFIVITIKIDSRGPVIFKQSRIGIYQRDFYIYKFRSMVQNAPQIGTVFTSQGDKRITRVGRILRKTSLDELPQLFNVLRGNMSIVGPRPDVRELAYFEDPLYNKRFEVKPGITGMAQVYGRSETTYEQRRDMDANYVDKISFMLDLKLIMLTAFSVVLRKGVN